MPFTKAIEDRVALNIGNAVKVHVQVVLNGGRNTLRHIDVETLGETIAFLIRNNLPNNLRVQIELLHQIAAQVQIPEPVGKCARPSGGFVHRPRLTNGLIRTSDC